MKKKGLQDDEMDKHKKVEIIDNSELETEAQDNINICEQYAKNHEETFVTLAERKQMWDGRLSKVDMVRHRIDMNSPDLRPINVSLTTPDRMHTNYRRCN